MEGNWSEASIEANMEGTMETSTVTSNISIGETANNDNCCYKEAESQGCMLSLSELFIAYIAVSLMAAVWGVFLKFIITLIKKEWERRRAAVQETVTTTGQGTGKITEEGTQNADPPTALNKLEEQEIEMTDDQ